MEHRRARRALPPSFGTTDRSRLCPESSARSCGLGIGFGLRRRAEADGVGEIWLSASSNNHVALILLCAELLALDSADERGFFYGPWSFAPPDRRGRLSPHVSFCI